LRACQTGSHSACTAAHSFGNRCSRSATSVINARVVGSDGCLGRHTPGPRTHPPTGSPPNPTGARHRRRSPSPAGRSDPPSAKPARPAGRRRCRAPRLGSGRRGPRSGRPAPCPGTDHHRSPYRPPGSFEHEDDSSSGV
jgi:hypothetical protein